MAYHNNSRITNRRAWTNQFLFGDPFLVTTVSIGLIGFVIAFFSSIVGNAASHDYPPLGWVVLVFQLCLTIGIVLCIGYDSVDNYRLALVALLAAVIPLATSVTNSLIYSTRSSFLASAAGFMFLIMIDIVWILYFGTNSSATPHAWVDSFAGNHDNMHARSNGNNNSQPMMVNGSTYGTHSSRLSQAPLHSPFQTATTAINNNNNNNNSNNYKLDTIGYAHANNTTNNPSGGDATDDAPMEYPYRAKALYAYEANVEDPNEVSFIKGEMFEVSQDVTSKWWAVRKNDGTVGIAPSNYLALELAS